MHNHYRMSVRNLFEINKSEERSKFRKDIGNR